MKKRQDTDWDPDAEPDYSADPAEDYDRLFRVKTRPRSLLSRESRPEVIDYQDSDGEWRKKIKMVRIKFDDRAKGVFLDEYRLWGRIGEAAAKVGISTACVRDHIKDDEEFAQAFMEAENEYREKLVSHHQDLLFNGTEKITYDRNGNVAGRETIYPIRLIELELKKHDAGYRDKQEVEHRISGGVMIAPAEMTSIEDWEARFSKAKDVTPDPHLLPPDKK